MGSDPDHKRSGRHAAAGSGVGSNHMLRHSARHQAAARGTYLPLGEDGLDEGGVPHLSDEVVEVVLHARELWSLV